MGGVPSTPRYNARPQETAEYLIGTFVGEKSFPLSSDFWKKLLEIPLVLQWPQPQVLQACEALAKNNSHTRHLAKILIHLACCLQESMTTTSDESVEVHKKALNAAYLSSIFLKYMIENAKSDNFEELYLSLVEGEGGSTAQEDLLRDQKIQSFVIGTVLTFIGTSDVSSHTFHLHHEVMNFMLVAMSSQLRSGPTPGPNDVHPFIDAAMVQDSSLVGLVVRRLLLNYITRPQVPLNAASYSVFSEEGQPGVLQKVGSAAANLVLLPFSYFNSSSVQGSRNPLADNSLLVLLVLTHYRRCVMMSESITSNNDVNVESDTVMKETSYFIDNPYCKALQSARDIEFDRVDVEGNAHSGPLVRLPFASLFDTIGRCLADESTVLLLYSLVQGNSDFLEYVLVRTDMDTLLMPILETLYNASRRTSSQIYMLLIILLILSQDSSFNASAHKLILPNVPWYQERLLHQTSLGSLMVIVLIRTIKYNLSKLRVYQISGAKNDQKIKIDSADGDDVASELHIYTDFLRIVLEILNAILTYALPRNPEVVYAMMHRQEVFEPFRNHPRFNELLENIYTVLDFFNSRMDAQRTEGGEWSVEKVLQVIIINCRSWRSEGMKMFNQLRFTYEQENHPEEFFIPYVWQLVLSGSTFSFNPAAIYLFPAGLPVEDKHTEDGTNDEKAEESSV
ncbi:hypothetical protein MKW92_029432 [Papaver armeniacum]|nr:hypothetical protein MKW92_029432 [Papaver armeniacum]